MEAQFDEEGRQTNYFDRREVVIHDEQTYKITAMSDGTIRKDNRQPPAPKPAPVTAATTFSYSPADMAQLRSTEGKMCVQVSDKGMTVAGPAVARQDDKPNWLTPSPREEWGDSYRRP